MTRRGADNDRPEAQRSLPTGLLPVRPGGRSYRRREANTPAALERIGVFDGSEPTGW